METKKNPKLFTTISAVFILIISVLIKISTFYPDWIENNYSRGIYPYISWFYRSLLGWIPFSIGDLLYAAATIYLIVKLIKIVKVLVARRLWSVNYKTSLVKAFFIVFCIYIYFNLTWGLNYNRPGIAYQLGLHPQSQNDQDLKQITELLLTKVNETRQILGNGKINYKPYPQIFTLAQNAYQATAPGYPFLEYQTRSIKRSMYGRMGNVLGFLGYFNPFTGEAQLNLTMPRFLIPYVTCHEMAHQLGYASESEASFVGYLAAIRSNDKVFHYSTYFDLFNYANHELFRRDSIAAKNNFHHLNALVKADFAELREYWRRSENPIEPLIKVFYDHYLKANQQTKGVKSYNEVIAWLIAYYKKYGSI